jgi:hypothetical protein
MVRAQFGLLFSSFEALLCGTWKREPDRASFYRRLIDEPVDELAGKVGIHERACVPA